MCPLSPKPFTQIHKVNEWVPPPPLRSSSDEDDDDDGMFEIRQVPKANFPYIQRSNFDGYLTKGAFEAYI
jgi:hypothetical protein